MSSRPPPPICASVRLSLISLLPWVWLGIWLGHLASPNGPWLPLVAAQAPPSPCPNVADQQFVVVVTTDTSLGLRLSERLEILEFIADESGRSRAVEATGLAEIGDRLIAVNNVSLTALSFKDALGQLRAATLPKHLLFQSGDGRCFVDSGADNARSPGINTTVNDGVLTVLPPSLEFDEVVFTTGRKDSELSVFAVLSADGQPPSCGFRELVVANPMDACLPLAVDATDKFIVVPSLAGCPAHQKAAFAQEAGAKGILFVQRSGHKPQQIRLPPDVPKAIRLPMAMVTFDAGFSLLQRLAKLYHADTPYLQFRFRAECASDVYAVRPSDAESSISASHAVQLASAAAGFLALRISATASTTLTAAAFDFMRPRPLEDDAVPATDGQSLAESSANVLPMGLHKIYFAPSVLNPCEQRPERQPPQLVFWRAEIADAFVALSYRTTACALLQQLDYFAKMNALGVIFSDADFPSSASEQDVRLVARQTSIPFVFVSEATMETMQGFGRDPAATTAPHVLVEFTAESKPILRELL
ncbi:hypothetical protein P43SY_002635 [Pythium insidiosum]|uniref:PDZ domain-containing protein n=1 Tax=Pythium insidiosum TaxID=114742 RepID=A0AAD5QDA9_PYTIN|nr:hypothetical protein P43SY_002635 [Pythium insidiosum]